MTARRILIADDHAAARRAIRTLIEAQPEWTVCAEASDGSEAVEQARRFRPDVVLLDFSMPRVNGLDAAREIRRVAPGAQTVVLTTHAAEQLAAEARRAGAAEVIAKSHAGESLIPVIEALPAPETTVHLGGAPVSRHRHIAAFFASDEERYAMLSPFIAEGLERGDKGVHLIDPPSRERYVHGLHASGIDVESSEAEQRLELLSWDETYLRGGSFDRLAMTDVLEQALVDGAVAGFPRVRVIGYMEWALQERPGVDELAEYETRLNDLLPNYPDIIVCAYDLRKFRGDTIIAMIRAHPAVLIAGELHDNAFYAGHSR
jgi:DNA-binding NarL/FixJ family response regulator